LSITLALATVDSVDVVSDDLIADPPDPSWQLAAHGAARAVVDDSGALVLQSDRAHSRATAWFPVDLPSAGTGAYEVTARLRVTGRGRRVQLAYARDDEVQPLWFGSHRIYSERWGTVGLSVRDAGSGPAQVGLLVVGEGGHAELAELQMVMVRRRWWWVASVVGLIGAWGAVGVAAARRLGWLPVALGACLMAGVVMPRPWVDRAFSASGDLLGVSASARLWVQKGAGHVGAFALIAAVLTPRLGAARTAGVMLALAVVTEASQQLAVARSASALDVGLDLIGAAVGIGVGVAISAGRTTRGSPG
jgi:hypothetical protein